MATETVTSLLNDLSDQINEGKQELGGLDPSTMGEEAAHALDCFSRAWDIILRLRSALNQGSDDGSDSQDDDSAGNTGNIPRGADGLVPGYDDGVSPLARHLLKLGTDFTVCGRSWVGKSEMRISVSPAFVTCRECKKQAQPVP